MFLRCKLYDGQYGPFLTRYTLGRNTAQVVNFKSVYGFAYVVFARSRVEVNQLQHNKTELATLREDVERIKVEHKQLKADLLKSEAELERHKASAKEKLRWN